MRTQVTMKDIAKKMDISIVSVSKALSGKEGVSEELREDIIRTAEDMGYVTKADRKKMSQRNPNIAIIVSEIFVSENAYYMNLYRELATAMAERDLVGILEIIKHEDEKAGVLPKAVEMKTVEQVVVIGEMKDSYLSKLQSTGVHMVFFDFQNEDFDVDSIVVDNLAGGYEMTRYLVKNGFTEIGYIGNYRATRSILDRMLGYFKYYYSKGIKINEDWIISDRDENTGVSLEFKLPKKMPQAFFCNCDEEAYRLIARLNSEGYKVPEDIAVVGFDDYAPDIPEGVELTTYRPDVKEMIKTCVHIVNTWSTNPEYRRGITLVHGDLIERKTGKRIGK